MRIKRTVYMQNAEYAREHDELPAYRESNKLNEQCATAIHQAIVDSNYELHMYDLKGAAQKMIDEYGAKRVAFVLANTVQTSYNDGRYSSSNKHWAQEFSIVQEYKWRFHVRSHPCLVDGFISRFREICAEREKTAAAARAEKREAKRSIIVQLHSEKEAPTQERYELTAVSPDEAALFYSSTLQEEDQAFGRLGYMRQDFGKEGNGFWNTWFDACSDLKTQSFKDEFDALINHLRDNGLLKDYKTMCAYCRDHSDAKLDGGRDNSYGFKVTTDSHVYYLRFSTLQSDYHLYAYAYQRDRLAQQFIAVTQPDGAVDAALKEKLEKAAAYIIETSARETTTGHYLTYADDIPSDILAPELFENNKNAIIKLMEEYASLAEAEVCSDGAIDAIMYLDYCPNYESDPGEVEEGLSYDMPDRDILDPLEKLPNEKEETLPTTDGKPSLIGQLQNAPVSEQTSKPKRHNGQEI